MEKSKVKKNMNMNKNKRIRNIPFSPPDMSEEEAKLAGEVILSA